MVNTTFHLILGEISLTVFQLIHHFLTRIYALFVIIQAIIEHLFFRPASVVLGDIYIYIALSYPFVPPLCILLHVIGFDLIVPESVSDTPVAPACPR